MKPPKINIPQPEPVYEELPTKVSDVKESTARDYNARAKHRKTLLSTILTKQYDSGNGQGGGNNLRQTLG